jgi:alcohol dehydrogenase (NADP+)
MHWPVAQQPNSGLPESAEQLVSLDQVPLARTWQAREELQQAGLRRQLGVSNFSIRRLQELMPAVSTTPHVNQVERHTYLQQLALLEYCLQQGIRVTEYLPLGPAPAADEQGLLEDPVVKAIAEALAASPAQVVLAWGLQQGTSVIPKSVRHERLAENMASLYLELPDAAMQQLAGLERNQRLNKMRDFHC